MIKNIVFDMGNVLVNYDAKRVCRKFIDNEADLNEVCASVFISPEWIFLDMGIITDEEALKKMCARLPERLHEKARLCMEHWHEYCMTPVSEMAEVIKTLKERGFGIYLCSNASLRLLTCCRQVIPGIEHFDGVLFSAEETCIKPQRQLYEAFFKRFNLKPEECYFIDDLQLNIDGARACGMDGYCHRDQDVPKLIHTLLHLS